MKFWRLLPLVSASMPFQMAVDEILFRRMEFDKLANPVPVLRFYFSSEPWVTVGYFSKQPENGGAARECRRLTGGGRVVHGKDFIFSLVARKSDDSSFGSVQESYLKIHDTVRSAFESLGKKVKFYDENEELPKGGECFVHPIASDLNLEGKKVAGGAQKRSSGVLLHHESIQIPEGLSVKNLYLSLRKSFERHFGISFENAPWDPEILSKAKKMSVGGYVPGKIKG